MAGCGRWQELVVIKLARAAWYFRSGSEDTPGKGGTAPTAWEFQPTKPSDLKPPAWKDAHSTILQLGLATPKQSDAAQDGDGPGFGSDLDEGAHW